MAKNNLPALRIHQFIPSSRTNGPGERAVLWVQGCSLGCPGCFNPLTHTRNAGELVAVDALFERIAALEGRVEGLTVSGGEPLQQRPALQALLGRVRAETNLSVLVFSGYTWREIVAMRSIGRLLGCLDVLLAGRYDQNRRVASGLLGSANKTIHLLTHRYSLADLEAVPEAEVFVSADGEVLFSGINPLVWDDHAGA